MSSVNRALTAEELAVARAQMVPPSGGWSDIGTVQAKNEKRWHTYLTGGRIYMQDIVTGYVEVKASANRKERRAHSARARRGAR